MTPNHKPAHAGGDMHAPVHFTPEQLTGYLLRGGFALLRCEGGGHLPPAVEHYLEGAGKADEPPADIGWIPERMRGLLPLLRGMADDNRRAHAEAKADAIAEMRAADEAQAVLQRIAQASRGR